MTTMLELHVRTETYLTEMFRRLQEREEGQTSVEYMGIIVAVAGLLALIIGAAKGGWATAITTKVQTAIDNIGGGGK